MSVISAPSRLVLPHCFLPSTVFKLYNVSSLQRASEIPSSGGVYLEGLSATLTRISVKVEESIRHAPVERDFVEFSTEHGSFTVTSEHRLYLTSFSQNPAPAEARNL